MSRPTPSSTCGCAICASSRKWKSAPRTRRCAKSAPKLKALIGSTGAAMEDDCRPDQGHSGKVRAEDRHSASAARPSAMRRSMTRPRSKRRWSCASRSPSSFRRRAGSARCAAMSRDFSGVAFKTDDALKFAFPTETTAKVMVFGSNGRFYTHRRLEAAGRARPWRAGPAVYRPRETPMWSRRWPIRAAANSWSRAMRATALSWRKTNASAPPARASRCSISRRRTRPAP